MTATAFSIRWRTDRTVSERSPLGSNVAGPLAQEFIGDTRNEVVRIASSAFVENHEPFQPLVFFGPPATGKTHLALGLVALFRQRFSRQDVTITTGADFARSYANAIDTDTLPDFRAKQIAVRCFLLDGLDQLKQKFSAQFALTQFLDHFVNNDVRVLVTSNEHPAAMLGLIPSLVSRLSSGLTIPFQPPGPDARRLLVQKLCHSKQLKADDAIVTLISNGSGHKLRSNTFTNQTYTDLTQAVNQLALAQARTVELFSENSTQVTLEVSPTKKTPSLNSIANAVAKQFGVRVAALKSPSRQKLIVRSRSVACYLARNLTNLSLVAIGEHFGGRDHTTVIHAVETTDVLLKTDPMLQKAVAEIVQQLSSS